MENLNQNGFVEMTDTEMREIEGGWIIALLAFIGAAIGGYFFAQSVSS